MRAENALKWQEDVYLGTSQVEQETAWAMDFSAMAIVEEEEDLIPSAGRELSYVKVELPISFLFGQDAEQRSESFLQDQSCMPFPRISRYQACLQNLIASITQPLLTRYEYSENGGLMLTDLLKMNATAITLFQKY